MKLRFPENNIYFYYVYGKLCNCEFYVMAACRFSSCAVWSHGLGMQASPQDKLELRSDLTGVVLRATSETEPPFSQTRPAGGGLT